MQAIEFSDEEAEVLREILRHGLSGIDIEVFRTDSRDFKEKLKHRRQVLEQLLEKMSHAPAAT